MISSLMTCLKFRNPVNFFAWSTLHQAGHVLKVHILTSNQTDNVTHTWQNSQFFLSTHQPQKLCFWTSLPSKEFCKRWLFSDLIHCLDVDKAKTRRQSYILINIYVYVVLACLAHSCCPLSIAPDPHRYLAGCECTWWYHAHIRMSQTACMGSLVIRCFRAGLLGWAPVTLNQTGYTCLFFWTFHDCLLRILFVWRLPSWLFTKGASKRLTQVHKLLHHSKVLILKGANMFKSNCSCLIKQNAYGWYHGTCLHCHFLVREVFSAVNNADMQNLWLAENNWNA